MQGAGLQTGCRPSKDGNDAMSMYALSETDSDYIRLPIHHQYGLYFPVDAEHKEQPHGKHVRHVRYD